MRLKSNVKKIMKEKGVMGKTIRELTGITDVTIAKVRTDDGIQECRIQTLVRIAEILGVSVKDLFDEVEESKEKAPREESL